MSILERISPEKIDVRVIWWLIFLTVAVTLLTPVGLPVVVYDRTRAVYNFIEKLPAGSIAIISNDASSGAYPELEAGTVAVLRHLMRRNVKVIVIGFGFPENAVLNEQLIKVGIDSGAIPPGKTYGVDYVNCGYIPGQETAVAGLATEFQKLVRADYRGTPADQLPILKGIEGYKQISLVVNNDGSNVWQFWMRHWATAYKVPFVTIPTMAILTTAMPYYTGGMILGVVAALRGAAEYERMLGSLAYGTKMMDMLSGSALVILALFALGNILEAKKKMTGGRK